MYEADFNRLCPLHRFASPCALTQEEKIGLSLPKQLSAFLMYPFVDDSIATAQKVHALCSHDNIRVYDALTEPGCSIVKSCKVCRLALAANFGIALLSPMNYNVMLEIGFLFGLQKNVLFLVDTATTKLSEIPFDLGDRVLVPFEGATSLEAAYRREFPPFLEKVKSSLAHGRALATQSQGFLYEYRSLARRDELLLDGTEISEIHLELLAQGDMSNFTENRVSVSERLLPFSVFEIEVLASSRTRKGSIELVLEERAERINRWTWVFDPPLRKGEELTLSYRLRLRGHRIMCSEDLLEVARQENKLDAIVVRNWRNVSVPTRSFSYTYQFPKGYEVSNPQPLVLRNKNIVKAEEARLEAEGLFLRSKCPDGTYLLQLKLATPMVYYSYGFAWTPPRRSAYESSCKKYGASPHTLKVLANNGDRGDRLIIQR